MMSEIEVLNPYLCKTFIYSYTHTETLKKHQETNHRVECYTCKYCVDAVNKKNDLTGHLRNHHEDQVEIKQSNIEALSNTYAKVSTSKLVCKRKDKRKNHLSVEDRGKYRKNKPGFERIRQGE